MNTSPQQFKHLVPYTIPNLTLNVKVKQPRIYIRVHHEREVEPVSLNVLFVYHFRPSTNEYIFPLAANGDRTESNSVQRSYIYIVNKSCKSFRQLDRKTVRYKSI